MTDAIAATQGVYSRQNTSRDAAESGVMTAYIPSTLPKSTVRVETTLSLARKPTISDVETRQSPNPRGWKIGATAPAATARMLSWESLTMVRRKSKVCKNQITMVAIKMTVNARCKKSLDFSHSSCATFFIPGMR